MLSEFIEIDIRQRFRDGIRGRFVLHDSRDKDYVVETNSRLEFTVYDDGRSLVSAEQNSKRRSLIWGRPTEFKVFLGGVHRGLLHRSRWWPFCRDTLNLDGKEYPLPDRLRSDVGALGVRLSWRFVRSTPCVMVATEENVLAGMLVLAWVWVRRMYLEG